MNGKLLLSLASLVLAFGSVRAQESFSLEEAQKYAIEHNLELANANLDQDIIEKRVWEITAQGLPQVSGEVSFQNFIDIPTQVLPANAFNPMAPEDELVGVQFGTNYNATGTLQLSQLIFSGKYLIGLQAVKASTNIYAKLTEKKEIEINNNVANAYYTVLVLQKNLSTLDSSYAKTKRMRELTDILVEEQVMIATNAKQLELAVLQIENTQRTLQGQVEVAKKLLKFQMNMPLESNINLTGSLDELVSNELTVDATAENNIDYRIVENQLELEGLQLKNQKANYLPTLAGFFSYQRQALRNEFNFFDSEQEWYPTTLWGLSLQVPIFSSGQRAAQVSQAEIQVNKTQNQLENVKNGIELQIATAAQNYSTAVDKVSFQSKSKEVALAVLNDTEILYKEGAATAIELTQAQTQYLVEETNYTQAMFELIQAKLELNKLSQ